MNQLDQEQRQAVQAKEAAILIMAGPGTGKTRTLSSRVIYLLEEGASTDCILALTFTNKAAKEMKNRIRSQLPAGKPLPEVTTFHAFCYQTLTDTTGQKPVLITETDRQQIIQTIKKNSSYKKHSNKEISLQLSLAKSSSKTQMNNKEIADLLQKYQKTLTEQKLYDFDDLLIQTLEFFEQHPRQRPNYQHILVDEFQDTNGLQYEFLKLLAKPNNIFVIGDPRQSIYGFRGATADVFDRFRSDWPKAVDVNLATNYRSVNEIVQLGNAIFPKGPSLKAHRRDKGHVRCIKVLNEYSEAEWVIDTIERHIGGSTMLLGSKHHASERRTQTFRDFAIIYRTHRTAKVVEKYFNQSGIPYQVVGEGSPYLKPDIAKLIHALRYLAKQSDGPELHGLSKTQVESLLNPLKASIPTQTVSQLVSAVAQALGFANKDTSSRYMRQFLNTSVRFDDQDLDTFLTFLESIAEQEFYDPSADAITLLTIHAAKGLEFNHVFLIGSEEEILPYYGHNEGPNLDEERRLFYVAVTRARNYLDIIHTEKRYGKHAKLSQFVQSIPQALLVHLKDPVMAEQRERLRKRALKQSQTSLF